MASSSENKVYVFDGYRVEASRKMLYRDGAELSLPPKAVETLLALLRAPGEIVGKEELIGRIWNDTVVDESNLAQYLHLLRKTFGDRPDGRPYVETLRRRGYRFNPVGEVREEAAEPSIDDKPIERRRRYWPAAAAVAALIAVVAAAALLYQRSSAGAEKTSAAPASGETSVIDLTGTSGLFSASISRDGRYFAYVEFESGRHRIYVRQTGQPTRREIVPPDGLRVVATTFSPDGEFIYFAASGDGAPSPTLYRVPTLGGPTTKVLDDVASPVSFSPDGSEMVFARSSGPAREGSLVIASTDGGRQRVLLTLDGSARTLANGGAWSPDGRTIAFGESSSGTSSTNGRYSVMGVDPQTGRTTSLSRERWDNLFRMDWTRDGAGLVFVGTREGDGLSLYRDQVYYVSVANGESKRVTNDGSRYDSNSLSTTDDNAVIAVLSNRPSRIYEVDAGGIPGEKAAKQLTTGRADGRAGIAPLPDGRVGYISRIGENVGIWTTDAGGGEPRQIFGEFPYIEELRATPDGKYFVFSAPRNGFSHLYRIDSGGGNLRQLTSGDGNEVDSTISPDSAEIVFVSSAFEGSSWVRRLRRASIDGGGEVSKLCDVAGETPHFSPDGRFLSLVENETVRIYSAADCTLLKEFATKEPNALNHGADWSPDGRLVVYPVDDESGATNLWGQPLTGGPPRRLTNFASGSIYFHAFSRDGRKIYVSRGDQRRNAVLIRNFK